MPTFVDQIDALLPQTQCQRCGFPRCYEYAEALADGQSEINRCPPGNAFTRTALATLLKIGITELNPECGEEKPRLLFRIDEKTCIGCTLCIQVCPVDAIVGSAKRMHSILIDVCTGCELCLPVCPVDCIPTTTHPAASKNSLASKWPGFSDDEVARARERTNARLLRLEERENDHSNNSDGENNTSEHIRNEIAAALKRFKQKKTK